MIYTVVSSTLFHGRIHGGSMALGPCGVLAIEDEHCPKWLKTQFDQSEIDGEDAKDDADIKTFVDRQVRTKTLLNCWKMIHKRM